MRGQVMRKNFHQLVESALVLGTGCLLGGFVAMLVGASLGIEGNNPGEGALLIVGIGIGAAVGALIAAIVWKTIARRWKRLGTRQGANTH